MSKYSEEIQELAKALSLAQGEFSTIPKTDENPFFKSKYANLPTIVEVASPILAKHGLSISQFIGADEQGDVLTTWLLHQSGQFISDAMRLRPVKNDPQSQGSAITYARRYSYMSVLGLVADEDDDGNKASKGYSSQPTPSPQTRRAAPQANREVDTSTGEIPDSSLAKRIEALSQENRKLLTEKMQSNNFPEIENLRPAAQKTVMNWIFDLERQEQQEAPF